MTVVSPDLRVKVTRALADMQELFEQQQLLSIAWSGGKDSTAVLILAIQAYKQAVDQGADVFPLFVTTADTGIENPAVQNYQRQMIAEIEKFAAETDLDIRVVVTRPSLAGSWSVRVFGGRAVPSFANSTNRQCAVDLKRVPHKRAMKKLIPTLHKELVDQGAGEKRAALQNKNLITVVGTRFGESAERDRRMAARGDVARRITENEDGFDVLPLIADWDLEDVWELLLNSGTDNGKRFPGFAPNYDKTFKVYADSSSECVIVAGINDRKAACGARHGCSLCTVSGATDKSMETMLELPEYAHMRGLNSLRNYLVNTQYDWSRRRWTPRSVDKETGYLRIGPDSYHPDEVERLLRFALTIDVREKLRAGRLRRAFEAYQSGKDVTWPDEYLDLKVRAHEPLDMDYLQTMVEPQFELVSAEQLVMIDFSWSRYGSHLPFHALSIYRDIYIDGQLVDVPDVDMVPRSPQPKARWLAPKVDRENDPRVTGAYDALAHSIYESCTGNGEDYLMRKSDGGTMVHHEEADMYHVSPEALGFLFGVEIEDVLRDYHDKSDHHPFAAAHWYLTRGMIALPKGRGSETDKLVRHGQHLVAEGLRPGDPGVYPEGTITEKEHEKVKEAIRQARQAAPGQDMFDEIDAEIFVRDLDELGI